MTAGLKTGFTTGSCAAASAKAAVSMLMGRTTPMEVDIPMPGGGRAGFPVASASLKGGLATASVKKYAGDDPDATDGVSVSVIAEWRDDADIVFIAGEGVGTVTKKGLQIPPGEAAINPGPRKMITGAVRELTERGVSITVGISNGAEMARHTFNPRLGIVGGLSILGTTGIVRPYSHPALKESLKCSLDVAVANGVSRPVFTAGNIGTKAARALFGLGAEQVIEVGNEWGFMLDCVAEKPVVSLLAVGHPGKLAKLAMGSWDTHSSRSAVAAPFVAELAKRATGVEAGDTATVEGTFAALSPSARKNVADILAGKIAGAINARTGAKFPIGVALVDMAGNMLGNCGDLEKWRS